MPLIASETHTNVTTNGGSDGSIDVTVSGGTAPYTYNWSNGASTQDLNNLTAGTYELTVKDAHGCTTSLSVTITQPVNGCNIVLTTTHTDVSCGGNSDGTIQVNVANAQEPITYTWSDGGPNSGVRGDLTIGIYDVLVTDANGCSASTEVTIGVVPPASVAVSDYNSGTKCETGTITLSLSSGVSPYTIQLYQDGMPYGDPVVTADNQYMFSGLGNGEYYAASYSSGASADCAGSSDTVIIMPIPQDLAITDITATTAVVIWTPLPCMEQYRVYYRATGDPDNTIMIKVNDNSGMVMLNNLKSHTKYKVKIQSVDLTDWKNVSKQSKTVKFQTLQLKLASEESTLNNLSVYPNPASTSVHISFMNNQEGAVTISIMDMAGQTLFSEQKNELPGNVSEDLNLSALSAGVYQLRIISTDGGVLYQSIVKTKE